jgi:hypothetical protein
VLYRTKELNTHTHTPNALHINPLQAYFNRQQRALYVSYAACITLPVLWATSSAAPVLQVYFSTYFVLTLSHCSFQITHTSQVLRLFGHHVGLCYSALTHCTVIHLSKLSTDGFQTAT